jgi:hypothetical protein
MRRRLVDERLVDLANKLGRPIEDVREQWSERAAIREYEGGMPRARAEEAAFDDVFS